jgi:Flp pilus assembly CpaF family ATPase
MSLQASAQDIVTDYGYLSEVLLKTDNLIDILVLSNSYTYTSYEEFGIINEKIIQNNNTLILKES